MKYFRENVEKAKAYEPGFQPKQAGVIKLNTNENPYPPSPAVLEAIRNLSAEKFRKYPDPLADEFRSAAGRLHGVNPDWIMCGNGGDELLSIAVRAFCDRERTLAYPVPTYSLYPVLAQLQDCPVVPVPFDDRFALPSPLARTDAALTIVCNPNAPTGSFIAPDALAKLAAELEGILLIDEAYVDFAEDNCLRLTKQFHNVIVLRSLSKGYSLAGLRFGYLVAQPPLINGLCKLKDSYNVDAVALTAATAAIKDQSYFRANIEKVKTERKRLTNLLRQLGLQVTPSSANFVLANTGSWKASQIYDKLTCRNIYVRYFAELGDKLRITIGTPEQNDKLVAALSEILSEER
jgi:histidinol-phosphate aminotransferase